MGFTLRAANSWAHCTKPPWHARGQGPGRAQSWDRTRAATALPWQSPSATYLQAGPCCPCGTNGTCSRGEFTTGQSEGFPFFSWKGFQPWPQHCWPLTLTPAGCWTRALLFSLGTLEVTQPGRFNGLPHRRCSLTCQTSSTRGGTEDSKGTLLQGGSLWLHSAKTWARLALAMARAIKAAFPEGVNTLVCTWQCGGPPRSAAYWVS